MLFLNHKGLSTVELLITLGFLGAVVYGGLSVLEKQKKQIIQANQEIQMTAITHEIRGTLIDRAACQRSLGGEDIQTPAGKITYLYQRQDANLGRNTTWEQSYSHQNIQKITQGPAQLGLKSYALDDSSEDTGSATQSTELIITFDRGQVFNEPERYPAKKIKIFYELTNAGKISTCALTPLEQESPDWELDSAQNKLFYKGEGLGIDQNSPEADLDINGVLLLRPVSEKLGPKTCSLEHQGQLISKGHQRRLFYCDSRQWRLLAP